MTLFEINSAITDLIAQAVDPETGEIDESVYAALDDLQMAKDQKIENVACWVKNLKADEEALKSEAAAMAKRAEAAAKKADQLEGYLKWALGGEKFSTVKCAVSFRRTSSVEVDVDPCLLPLKFQRIKTTVEARKPELKEFLKGGGEVEGCKIVEKLSVTIK